MTILQLRYAVECKKTGSLSTAAQNLFTSTSNMSKSLKALEDELGYNVFIRSLYGLVPTEKGRYFLEHALNILNECTQIENLQNKFYSTHFTLASIPSSYACLAFSELAKRTTKKLDTHIQFDVLTSRDAIAHLKNHLCDLAVIGCCTNEEKMVEHQLRHQEIQLTKLAELPFVVYLPQNHPLITQYSDVNDILHGLMHYPYIEFNNDSFLSPHPIIPFINKNNVIKINDRVWRLQILKDTNGFASGADVPEEVIDYRGLHKFAIPNSFASIFVASQTNQIFSDLALEYTNILKENFIKAGVYVDKLNEP